MSPWSVTKGGMKWLIKRSLPGKITLAGKIKLKRQKNADRNGPEVMQLKLQHHFLLQPHYQIDIQSLNKTGTNVVQL